MRLRGNTGDLVWMACPAFVGTWPRGLFILLSPSSGSRNSVRGVQDRQWAETWSAAVWRDTWP